ncbi:MAG: hypothetical protein RLZZ272_471 [Actinomycetota bacterium]|jgi:hypothetical protein
MTHADPVLARRYATSDARHEVMALLRVDHPSDERVRAALDAVVVELVFLGRVDIALSERGVASPPRGLRWWYEHLAGADGAGPAAAGPADPAPHGPVAEPRQLALALDDVLAGYGDVDGRIRPDRTPTDSEPLRGTHPATRGANEAGPGRDGTEAVA